MAFEIWIEAGTLVRVMTISRFLIFRFGHLPPLLQQRRLLKLHGKRDYDDHGSVLVRGIVHGSGKSTP